MGCGGHWHGPASQSEGGEHLTQPNNVRTEPSGKKREPISRATWIGAGATILAAVIVGIFTLHSGGHAAGPTAGQTSQTHGKGSATPGMAVRFQGPITINGVGIDLDDNPPTVGLNSYTLSDTSGVLSADTNVTFAVWTGAANPSYAQCHEWVLTNGAQEVQPATGMQLCVLTAAGRTALLTITSVSSSNSTAEAQATVWTLGS